MKADSGVKSCNLGLISLILVFVLYLDSLLVADKFGLAILLDGHGNFVRTHLVRRRRRVYLGAHD
jgi:hypothetical protein